MKIMCMMSESQNEYYQPNVDDVYGYNQVYI